MPSKGKFMARKGQPGTAWSRRMVSPQESNCRMATMSPWSNPGSSRYLWMVLPPNTMHAVREKARTGEWRKDSKSDEWIGHVVAEILGLDTENEDDLNKINPQDLVRQQST